MRLGRDKYKENKIKWYIHLLRSTKVITLLFLRELPVSLFNTSPPHKQERKQSAVDEYVSSHEETMQTCTTFILVYGIAFLYWPFETR